MARPQYENSATMTHEWDVAHMVEEVWGGEAQKLPMAYGMDFALFDRYGPRSLLCMFEVKGANYPALQWPDALVSLMKWRVAAAWHAITKHPAYLLWAYTDEVRWTEVTGSPPEWARICYGGRNDRGDAADQELLVRVPVAMLNSLSVLPAWVK